MTPDSRDELIPTRQSLLERLREWNDHASWQEFFDTYWKLIYRTARSAGLNSMEAEDVVQETIISVAKNMPGFRYKPQTKGGSFKKWLLNVTAWRIKDQFRRRLNAQPLAQGAGSETSEACEVPELADPISESLEIRWDAEWEQNLVDAAILRVKSQIDPRHYQIFYLKAVKGMSALKVSRYLKVSLSNVYTVTHRVSKKVRTTIKQLRENLAFCY